MKPASLASAWTKPAALTQPWARKYSMQFRTASREQSAGVVQVGEAVTEMDQVIQQNAALGEEMAASARSLQQQAQALVDTVAIFKY